MDIMSLPEIKYLHDQLFFNKEKREKKRLILIPELYSVILGEHNLSFHNISYNTFSGGNNQHGYPRQAPPSWQPSKRKGIKTMSTPNNIYHAKYFFLGGSTSRFENLKRSFMFPIPGSSS
jgi:hypothetical protein